jgi:D-beta-D-heptose 7-phosphate kinase/D-beta-D-heptose 1-phosphate adenosyltransferase
MKSYFSNTGRILDTVTSKFPSTKVLVVGDILFDRYLWGMVERISPEAPVPVVKLHKRSHMPGGAANVAANLCALGFDVELIGFTGQDHEGNILTGQLQKMGINIHNVVSLVDRPTITKTRIIGGHQQVVRVDAEDLIPYEKPLLEDLFSRFRSSLENGPGAVVLSDYGKGSLDDSVISRMISLCRKKGIPVLVDPKGTDFSKYCGATAITPNQNEFSAAVGERIHHLEGISSAGRRMIRELDLDFLVVTRGEKGMVLLDDTSTLEIPTQARDVFDVSGAGDTVIATLAGAMASGLSIEDSVRLSNLAAGVVVGKIGTSPVERDDLINALSETDVLPLHGKIYNDLADLLAKVNAWKDAGCSVIFTNGCFDVIHSGHVLYLEKAAREGDKLIVGVNSDESVKRLKGSSRPVNQEEDRMEVLAALSCVDAVIKFDEDTPLKLIDSIQPDVLVKGSDYTEEQVAGASQVKSRGGRVVLVPLLEGRSTTGIIEKIRSADMDSRKKHTS